MAEDMDTACKEEIKQELEEEAIAPPDNNVEVDEKPEISEVPGEPEPVEVPETEPVPEPPVVEEIPPHEEEVKKDLPTEEETSKPVSESCDITSYIMSCSPGGDGDGDISSVEEKDPVVDLLHWRDVKVSAVAFGLTLLVLLSLCCFSIVSVFSYLALSLLTVTVSFRLYKFVLQTLNGTQQPNPFQPLLDADISLSADQVHKYTDAMLGHINCFLQSTRDLVLVKNTIASVKFGIMMWLLTYIGCCFNGLTLLIIAVVLAFALPPVYEKYQTPIDAYYGKAKSKIEETVALVRSKIPGGKPKTQ